jgi:xanthine phosphoribosyltransferase
MTDTLTPKAAVAEVSTSQMTRAQKLLAASLITQSRSFTYTFKNGKSEELLILDVTHFLNHRVNTKLIDAIGEELAETVGAYSPDVILTAPSSGNIPAISTSLHMESMPDVIYAPKGMPITMQQVYQAKSRSYTHGKTVDLTVSKDCLTVGTQVAICDDFLDTGKTALDLINICDQAGATPVVFFFVIEKPYHGREVLVQRGVNDDNIVSLIKIDAMAEGKIKLSGFENWFELARK